MTTRAQKQRERGALCLLRLLRRLRGGARLPPSPGATSARPDERGKVARVLTGRPTERGCSWVRRRACLRGGGERRVLLVLRFRCLPASRRPAAHQIMVDDGSVWRGQADMRHKRDTGHGRTMINDTLCLAISVLMCPKCTHCGRVRHATCVVVT